MFGIGSLGFNLMFVNKHKIKLEPEVIEAHDVASRTYVVLKVERIREASKRCWC